MGNRALVVFHDAHAYAETCVYLHWDGDEVERLLEQTKRCMRNRRDLDQVCAMFCAIAYGRLTEQSEPWIRLYLTNFDAPPVAFTGSADDQSRLRRYWNRRNPGDNGVFLVDVRTWQVLRFEE